MGNAHSCGVCTADEGRLALRAAEAGTLADLDRVLAEDIGLLKFRR